MYATPNERFAPNSAEAKANCLEIWAIVKQYGWTEEAAAAMCGNMQAESAMNPWQWQGFKPRPSTGSPWTNIGYGFYQYTPASKYIDSPVAKGLPGYAPNFSDKTGNPSDGVAQVHFMIRNDPAQYVDAKINYSPSHGENVPSPYYGKYPTFQSFYTSTDAVSILTEVWTWNWERPDPYLQGMDTRKNAAAVYYTYIHGSDPGPGPGPGPGPDPEPPAEVTFGKHGWIYQPNIYNIHMERRQKRWNYPKR